MSIYGKHHKNIPVYSHLVECLETWYVVILGVSNCFFFNFIIHVDHRLTLNVSWQDFVRQSFERKKVEKVHFYFALSLFDMIMHLNHLLCNFIGQGHLVTLAKNHRLLSINIFKGLFL